MRKHHFSFTEKPLIEDKKKQPKILKTEIGNVKAREYYHRRKQDSPNDLAAYWRIYKRVYRLKKELEAARAELKSSRIKKHKQNT